MLQTDHFELLDRLRLSKTSEDRQSVLGELMIREQNEEFGKEDLISLLENTDLVYQMYAIGALGRMQMQGCAAALKSLFSKSNNPLILVALLDTFLAYESEEFLDVVLKKLKKPVKITRFFKNQTSSIETAFDRDMILEQILVPALKYLQKAGSEKVGKSIVKFLDHEDANVRWHTLTVFDKLMIPLEVARLAHLKSDDDNALVREQAAIMLEKIQNV